MLINWDSHMATLPDTEKERYQLTRNMSETFAIPRLEKDAIIVESVDFPAVLMAAALKAEEKYRIPANEGPVPFDLYEKHLDSFKRRFKGSVKVWYPHAALHVQDTQNGRRGHFRLRPQRELDHTNPAAPVYETVDVV
jgi:hypothetical protein